MDYDGFHSLLKIMERCGLASLSQCNDILESLGQSSNKNINPDMLVDSNIVSPWQLEKLLKGETGALRFQDYILHGPIALGELARTYKARHSQTNEWVALKVLRKQFQKSPPDIGKFQRETQFLHTFTSEYLVKPIQTYSGCTNIPPFFTYPWFQYGSIHDQLQIRGSYPTLEAIHLLNNFSLVLLDLQKQGISHGNISKTKFLLSSPRTVHVINLRHGSQLHAGPDQTPYYESSPKYRDFSQATGTSPGDIQTDVFFAGCLFYLILTGRELLPTLAKQRLKLLQGGQGSLPFNSQLEKAIPREILPIIRNMTNLDAKARYKDFSQVLPAIRAVKKKLEENALPGCEGKTLPTAFLVIADNNKRQLLRSYLQNRGLRVLGATSIPRALDAYRREPFRHLILEMEGFESVRTGYLELVGEAESSRMFLNILFLPGHTMPLHIPARHGNNILSPPHELSAIFEIIRKNETP